MRDEHTLCCATDEMYNYLKLTGAAFETGLMYPFYYLAWRWLKKYV